MSLAQIQINFMQMFLKIKALYQNCPKWEKSLNDISVLKMLKTLNAQIQNNFTQMFFP